MNTGARYGDYLPQALLIKDRSTFLRICRRQFRIRRFQCREIRYVTHVSGPDIPEILDRISRVEKGGLNLEKKSLSVADI